MVFEFTERRDEQPASLRRRAVPERGRLRVGPADDPAEHDAARVADAVLRALDGEAGAGTRIRRSAGGHPAPLVGPEGGTLDAGLAARISRAGGGAPLAPQLRERMEGAFGADFSRVRLHPGSDLAPAIGARAFTLGNDIHLARGEYRPAAREGQHLLAHELAHVVQQQGGGGTAQLRRMWSVEDYDEQIPKHPGWLIRDQIRDWIKEYFTIVKKYPRHFASRAEANTYFARARAEAAPIIERIFRNVKSYWDGCIEETKRLPDGPEKDALRTRFPRFNALKTHVEFHGDDELRELHHDVVMPLIVKESGLPSVSARDRVGNEQAGAAQGGVNVLGRGTYRVGGREITGYTKPDRPNVSDPGGTAGITIDQAKMSLRSVATYKVSELLNLGLIPETVLISDQGRTGQLMTEAHGSAGQGNMPTDEFSVNNDKVRAKVDKLLDKIKKPGVDEETKKGVLKEIGTLAGARHGITWHNGKLYEMGSVVADFDWWDPVMQRHLNALQFFDLLVGHADRHSGNYIVDFDPNQANRPVRRIQGIDNDDTWGKEMTAPRMGSAHYGKTPMPQIIDANTAVKFLNADWGQIQAILVQYTMTAEEIAAAQGRFTALQAHIVGLVQNGRIGTSGAAIEPAVVWALQSAMQRRIPGFNLAAVPNAPVQWGAATRGLQDASNSYAGLQHQEVGNAQRLGQAPYQPAWK